MFFDVHSHLFDWDGSCAIAVLTGYDVSSNRLALSSAKRLNMPFALGIAPQTILMEKITYEEFLSELEFIKANKPNAIGEIGIDWKYNKSSIQDKYFLEQLFLAEELNIPVVIHSRDAEDYIANLIIEYSPSIPIIMHYYSGSLETAKRLIEFGYISIVPFHSKKRKQIIKEIPLDRLLTETDSPYAGKTPCDVKKSLEYIASIKQEDLSEIKEIIFNNARSLFYKK